jgi:hypothetical protein
VHPAAAFQLCRPARGRHLQHVGDHERLAAAIFFVPEVKRQRVGVNADGRSGARRDGVKRGIRSGGDEDGEPQVVGRIEQGVIARGQILGDVPQLGQRHSRIDADDFQRVRQSVQMPIEAKEFSAERAELLGDGDPLHEAGISDGDDGLTRRNETAIEIRDRLEHDSNLHRQDPVPCRHIPFSDQLAAGHNVDELVQR